MRRVIAGTLGRQHGKELASYFEPWDQHGVAVPGETEVMALVGNAGLPQGCTTLALDGRNARHHLFSSKILPAVASAAPDLVGYANNLYARGPPNLPYRKTDGSVQAIPS